MLLFAGLLVLTTSGCASTGLARTASLGVGSTTQSARQARHNQGWLQSGADGLALAQQTVRAALHRVYEAWAGTPYLYGGDTKKGVDCSSFVQQTVDKVDDYELPRTSVEQAQVGTAIPRADLKAGDLVFFKTGPDMHHVGIYVGNGRFMHASASQGVTISRLNNAYWRRHYWQSRRIVADTVHSSELSRL